ncbi:MAG: hypothetical protein J3Q66DRAFT_400941 [Benniella sp.]|nr:MAG: hypothetical protein J3Q66DRAFT_400941 [Benniella sp.]
MVSYINGLCMINLHELSIHYMPTTYGIVNFMAETKTHKSDELMFNIPDSTSVHDFACTVLSTVSFMDPTDLYFMPSILSEAMSHHLERVGMEGIASESQATISENFTMMTTGLASIPLPMVSAGTMSRLSFEIRKDLDPAIVSKMSSMLHLYVNSSNHEIVKSALRFITTISLDVEITPSTLARYCQRYRPMNLLVNIMKRCVPDSNTPEMGLEGDADEEREEATKKSDQPQVTFGHAYDDALYGGERDLGDGNSEEEDTESDYLESLKSVDGFTSEQGGEVRFNKTNRRGAQGKDEEMEMEVAGGAGPIRSKLKEKEQAKVIDRTPSRIKQDSIGALSQETPSQAVLISLPT